MIKLITDRSLQLPVPENNIQFSVKELIKSMINGMLKQI
jgi:hypothetical protein